MGPFPVYSYEEGCSQPLTPRQLGDLLGELPICSSRVDSACLSAGPGFDTQDTAINKTVEASYSIKLIFDDGDIIAS